MILFVNGLIKAGWPPAFFLSTAPQDQGHLLPTKTLGGEGTFGRVWEFLKKQMQSAGWKIHHLKVYFLLERVNFQPAVLVYRTVGIRNFWRTSLKENYWFFQWLRWNPAINWQPSVKAVNFSFGNPSADLKHDWFPDSWISFLLNLDLIQVKLLYYPWGFHHFVSTIWENTLWDFCRTTGTKHSNGKNPSSAQLGWVPFWWWAARISFHFPKIVRAKGRNLRFFEHRPGI